LQRSPRRSGTLLCLPRLKVLHPAFAIDRLQLPFQGDRSDLSKTVPGTIGADEHSTIIPPLQLHAIAPLEVGASIRIADKIRTIGIRKTMDLTKMSQQTIEKLVRGEAVEARDSRTRAQSDSSSPMRMKNRESFSFRPHLIVVGRRNWPVARSSARKCASAHSVGGQSIPRDWPARLIGLDGFELHSLPANAAELES
jgi:hypothetical protein